MASAKAYAVVRASARNLSAYSNDMAPLVGIGGSGYVFATELLTIPAGKAVLVVETDEKVENRVQMLGIYRVGVQPSAPMALAELQPSPGDTVTVFGAASPAYQRGGIFVMLDDRSYVKVGGP